MVLNGQSTIKSYTTSRVVKPPKNFPHEEARIRIELYKIPFRRKFYPKNYPIDNIHKVLLQKQAPLSLALVVTQVSCEAMGRLCSFENLSCYISYCCGADFLEFRGLVYYHGVSFQSSGDFSTTTE